MVPKVDILLGLSVYSRIGKREAGGGSFRIFLRMVYGYMMIYRARAPLVVKGVKNMER